MEVSGISKANKITRDFISTESPSKLLLTVVIVSVVLGTVTGFILANKGKGSNGLTSTVLTAPAAKNAQTDTRTFKDFAEGVIKTKPQATGADYSEGTHLLQRDGAIPVALTSSVVDLSKYVGKKVKVFGETQKALKEGWLMDVGKVEEVQ